MFNLETSNTTNTEKLVVLIRKSINQQDNKHIINQQELSSDSSDSECPVSTYIRSLTQDRPGFSSSNVIPIIINLIDATDVIMLRYKQN